MPTSIWSALTARLSRRSSDSKASTAPKSHIYEVTPGQTIAAESITNNRPGDLPDISSEVSIWQTLNAAERESVVEYFAASRQLVALFDSIRSRRRATDADQIMEAYRQAELKLVWMGLRTVFPPAIRTLSSCEPTHLERKGFLSRVQEGENATRYTAAMVRHLKNLRKQFEPKELDSNWTYNPGH